MIEINQLQKAYGQTKVLDIPRLDIGEGEVVGIVGNNGAGKTTLFSLMLDLVKATQGTAKIKGENTAQTEGWKSFTSAYLDEGFLIEFLRPDEYFHFIGKLHGLTPDAVDRFVEGFQDISAGEVIGSKKLIRELSKGNQKKTGLIGTLIGHPELIIWDEPFANLDPSTQLRIKNLVREQSKGRTFLISSHDLNHIYEVCERIVIIHKGEVVRDILKSETSLEELYRHFSAEEVG